MRRFEPQSARSLAAALRCASACDGAPPSAAAAAAACRQPPSTLATARAADRRHDRVRRDAEVAAIDDDPAADRRPDHADPRQIGRPRPSGRAADADRSAPAAGRRLEPGGRTRRARSGGRLCAAAGAAHARSVRRRRDQQAGTGAAPTPTLRTAEAILKALQAQVQQQEVQLRYFTDRRADRGRRRRRAGPRRQSVTPQTVLTTIDQNETLEVYVLGADRAGAGAARTDCRFRFSAATATRRWRRGGRTSSRRTSTTRRSRCS